MIGILGGMGPMASANLYYKIIEVAQKKYMAVQDTDFPPMIIYNLPLFGFDETGILDYEFVKQQLVYGVIKLEQAGCDFVVIACNTVHYFVEELASVLSIPIISMVDAVVNQVKVGKHITVGLLSSENTRATGIYQKALAKAGLDCHLVTPDQQVVLNDIILKVMSGNQGVSETQELKNIISYFEHVGASGVLLGCTELPLAIKQSDVSLKLYDCTQIIAESILARVYN
ncbi:MAG TPA: amino acid racemase [Candidatus Magasanikbacteria bacterium]|nr:amino acid racemase [Candidatus Magasanikbacteria bacterium]